MLIYNIFTCLPWLSVMKQTRGKGVLVTGDTGAGEKEWFKDRGRDAEEWGEKLEEGQKEAAASKAIDDLQGHAAVMTEGETKKKWRKREEEDMVVGGREA